MCLAIPGKIKKEYGSYATVDVLGNELKVNIMLIDQPSVGDYVLIHAGCAIQRIDMEYYDYLYEFYEKLL